MALVVNGMHDGHVLKTLEIPNRFISDSFKISLSLARHLQVGPSVLLEARKLSRTEPALPEDLQGSATEILVTRPMNQHPPTTL